MSTTHSNVTEGTHHHTEFEIFVNGRRREVSDRELTYDEVLRLAFGDNIPTGPNIVITVTYRKAEHDKRGSLIPGESVEIKNGTVFDVRTTDKS